MMKKMYIEPEMEIVTISAENVILSTSGDDSSYTLTGGLVNDNGGSGLIEDAL